MNKVKEPDTLQRFLINKHTRGEVVHLDKTVRSLINIKEYPLSIQSLISEMACATTLLSAILKFDGTISIQANSGGPLKWIMAESDNQQNIRGLARFDEDIVKSDTQYSFKDLINNKGKLAITITPAKGKQYQGIVPLESESLSDCISDYFKNSEQLDTFIQLFSQDGIASGLLLQRLPQKSPALGSESEDHIDFDDWNRFIKLAETLKQEELLCLDNETILTRLYHQEDVVLYPKTPVRFKCSCSRDRTKAALAMLEREEVEEILMEKNSIRIQCQFCSKEYSFDQNEVHLLLNQHNQSNSEPTLH